MEVELIWQRDCPNVTAARRSLMRGFSLAGVPARWREWCLDDADCPAHARGFGSPSVLVDGIDVMGLSAGDGASCRLYPTAHGTFSGAPTSETIASALQSRAERRSTSTSRFSWGGLGAAAPALGVALLPKIACPACWPAYAGVLSAMGVTFLIDTQYLFALTVAFLVVALFFLGFRASRRWGYGPLVSGLLASALLLVGKFYFDSDVAMFSGVGLLMVASVWNSWPRKLTGSPEDPSLKPTASGRSCCDAPRPQEPTACCASSTQGEAS